MDHRIIPIAAAAALLLSATDAGAVIARRGVLTVDQPDGTTLRLQLVGDEHRHYYMTEDGYALCEAGGFFEYASLDADGAVVTSGRRAVNVTDRSADDRAFLATVSAEAVVEAVRADAVATRAAAGPRRAAGYGLFPGTAFPSKGEQKGLVILVQYTDISFTISDPQDYFSRMLNEQGFSDYTATGSARDWYMESSSNQFIPSFDVYGPVTLSNKREYYGANDSSGDDVRPEQMAIEACKQLDATVDFSQYDRDGDGYIDNVYIFYAGKGEADGGGANTVWPHSWEVSSATSIVYKFDGVRLDRYACSNEWDNSYNRPDGIGTFCHEFAHVMGLPDLYATDYSSAYTPGEWSVMDYGPYNNQGRTPPTMSVFERNALGWCEPEVISGKLDATLDHILTSNSGYVIPTSKATEYFLLENRQQTGTDAYIPGHGMLIWHIDYVSSVWNSNTVNNSASHQYVDIVEAGRGSSSRTATADPFPGTKSVTSFTSSTSPALEDWSGNAINLPITDIAEHAGVITFKVCGGMSLEAPGTPTFTSVAANGFTAEWSPSEGAEEYTVTLSRGTTELEQKTVTDPACPFGGLQPETTYTVKVVATWGDLVSEPSEASVTTLAASFANYTVALNPVTDINRTGATLSWEKVPGATDYLLDLWTVTGGEGETDVNDFADGTTMPDGWATTGTSTYTSLGYYGAASPSLKLAKDGQYVQSPMYDRDVEKISFWVRGATASTSNTYTVKALVPNSSWTSVTSSGLENSEGVTVTYAMPAGTRAVKIIYNKAGSGNMAIDDVVVTVKSDVDTAYVCTARSLGDVGTYAVTGLQDQTTYYYTVQGSNGSERTIKSAVDSFTTGEPAGIDAPGNDAATVAMRLDGRVLTVAAPAGTLVTVCDVAGRVVCSQTAPAYGVTVRIGAPGLYIVRAGDATAKLIVK